MQCRRQDQIDFFLFRNFLPQRCNNVVFIAAEFIQVPNKLLNAQFTKICRQNRITVNKSVRIALRIWNLLPEQPIQEFGRHLNKIRDAFDTVAHIRIGFVFFPVPENHVCVLIMAVSVKFDNKADFVKTVVRPRFNP